MGERKATAARPRSSRPLWVMLGGVFVLWAALWAWRTVAAPKDLVPWRADVDAAMNHAAADRRPVLLNFTADWCPPCRAMTAEVYSDEAFAAWLPSRVTPVKVDLTAPGAAEESLAMRYEVEHIPTLILLDADGGTMARITGFVPAEALRRSLGEAVDRANIAPAGANLLESAADGS